MLQVGDLELVHLAQKIMRIICSVYWPKQLIINMYSNAVQLCKHKLAYFTHIKCNTIVCCVSKLSQCAIKKIPVSGYVNKLRRLNRRHNLYYKPFLLHKQF